MSTIPSLPSIIEFHISNTCTGRCVICSKAHGGVNDPLVSDEVIDKSIDRIQETGKDYLLQLGGDGDSFLHAGFLDYCEKFARCLPDSRRCLFTSGYSMTSARIERIVQDRLLDEVQIRIDSLDQRIYRQSTGLNLEVVLRNIREFAAKNTHAHLCIIYMPLYRYRQACLDRLGKEPTYAGRLNGLELWDEWADVQKYFADLPSKLPIETRVTGISLWAERTDCAYSHTQCPRLPENVPGDMTRQLYIYPNGNYGLCGYDDAQCEFILGNVFYHSIASVWGGTMMQQCMERIRNRTPEDYPACCINPEACRMLD